MPELLSYPPNVSARRGSKLKDGLWFPSVGADVPRTPEVRRFCRFSTVEKHRDMTYSLRLAVLCVRDELVCVSEMWCWYLQWWLLWAESPPAGGQTCLRVGADESGSLSPPDQPHIQTALQITAASPPDSERSEHLSAPDALRKTRRVVNRVKNCGSSLFLNKIKFHSIEKKHFKTWKKTFYGNWDKYIRIQDSLMKKCLTWMKNKFEKIIHFFTYQSLNGIKDNIVDKM